MYIVGCQKYSINPKFEPSTAVFVVDDKPAVTCLSNTFCKLTILSSPCPITRMSPCNKRNHLRRSLATTCVSLYTVPSQFFSLFLNCAPVLFGIPRLLFPSEAQVRAIRMIKLLSLRKAWPIHFHHFPWIVLDSGIVAVISYNCLFDIMSGKCIFKNLLRHLQLNVSSFSSSFSVVPPSLESYSNKEMTFILNMLSFVLVLY